MSYQGVARLLLLMYLGGCSGGSDPSLLQEPMPGPVTRGPIESPPASPFVGRWTGTLSERSVHVLIRDNGESWWMYTVVGDPNTVAGAVRGTVTLDESSVSGRLMDQSFEEGLALPVELSLSEQAQALSGTIRYSNGAVGQVRLVKAPTIDQEPTVARAVGTYHGFGVSQNPYDLIVVTPDSLSGQDAAIGCTFTGVVALPAVSGAWNATIRWDPLLGTDACTQPEMRGVMFVQTVPPRLFLAVEDDGRTVRVIVMGLKDE